MRGCYYDGGEHSRENCEELRKALKRGDMYTKGPVLFSGREDASSNIKVPIPREDGNGKMMWQREWVMNELMKKESQALVNSVTLESCSINSRYDGSGRASGCESRVAYAVTSGASKGKGKANFRDSRDDDDQDSDFPVEFYNGHPVIRTTAQEKQISTTVDKMEAQIPQRILRRTQPLKDCMDIDVEN